MIKRPKRLSKLLVGCLVLTIFALLPASAMAVDKLSSGTNSKQAKKQAINSIPYDSLTPETKAKISGILEKPSIYRRLPITSIDVDPDMYLFLVRYPEVLVNIWQIMGVTQMEIERTGPFRLNSDDGAGAKSNIELIYGTHNKNIYYAEGTYSGPLLKRKLHGRAVMILHTKYERGPNGKPKTRNSLDVFVKVENATAGLIAKTLNPIVGSTADHNFVETLKFVQRLNETTEQNGVGVQRMAYRLKNLNEQVRDQFVQVAGTVYERNAKLQTPSATQPSINAANAGSSERYPSYSSLNYPLPVNPTHRAIRQSSARDSRQRLAK